MRLIVGILAGVGLLVALACVGVIGLTVLGSAAPLSPRSVEYRVTASGTSTYASLTYKNATDDTEQQDTNTPWSKAFRAPSGAFLYVSAQHAGSGPISCDILVDGKVIKHAESRGQYVIASCSAKLP